MTDLASRVDAGLIRYDARGWFGGRDTDADRAVMRLTFQDTGGARLGSKEVGSVTPADRGNATALVRRVTGGMLPAGTRTIRVDLILTRVTGGTNDAYVDDLMLSLRETPALQPLAGYRSKGYLFDIVAHDAQPDFYKVSHDTSSWKSGGVAPFGPVGAYPGSCRVAQPATQWTSNDTDLLVRAVIMVPAGATAIAVKAAHQDGITVYWNEDLLGSNANTGCAASDQASFSVPAADIHSGPALLAARVRAGTNLSRYLDLKVEATLDGRATTLLVPHEAPGWSYRTGAYDFEPGFEQPSYDASGWTTGQGAFGGVRYPYPSGCATSDVHPDTYVTWGGWGDLLLRRTDVTVPAGATGVRVELAVDNAATVWWNGNFVGSTSGQSCANEGQVAFDVPSVLLSAGPAVVAIRASDYGAPAFIDARITAFVSPPAAAPEETLETHSFASTPLAHSLQNLAAHQAALQADPVHAVFGNFTYSATDLAMSGQGIPVTFTRSYNSALPGTAGPLGYGWTLGLDQRLADTAGEEVEVRRADGRIDRYEDDGATGPTGSQDRLSAESNGTWVLTTRTLERYTFDADGRLVRTQDADGHATTYGYTGSGPSKDLTSVTDGTGRRWTLTYDSASPVHRVVAVVDPATRRIQYDYDDAGDLVAVTRVMSGTCPRPAASSPSANCRVTRYTYDDDHRLTRITDARGNLYVAHEYDSEGRVIVQTDGRGVHAFAYQNGRTVYTDPNGAVTTTEFDAEYRVTKVTDGAGRSTSFTYNAAGLVAAQADGKGKATRFEYDPRGNTIKVTTRDGQVTTMEYDIANRMTKQVDPLNRVTRWTYDLKGHLLTEVDALVEAPTDRVTRHTYASTSGRGAAAGQRTSMTDRAGTVTRYAYDARGRLCLTLVAATLDPATLANPCSDPITGTDATNIATRLRYDDADRVTAMIDPRGKVMTSTYDAANALLSTTAPDGGKTTYTYDAVGNELTATDPMGKTTTRTYDAANDLVRVKNALGQVTRLTYDGVGRVLTQTTPNGVALEPSSATPGLTTTMTYDAAGLLKSQKDPLGNVMRHEYDANGLRTLTIDALQKVTRYGYDAMGRLRTVTEPPVGSTTAGVTTYGYDAAGRHVSTKDALGRTTLFRRDPLDRLLLTRNPLGHETTRMYDSMGRILSERNGAGQTTRFSYDALGRLMSAKGPDVQTLYTYDAAGNRLSMRNGPASAAAATLPLTSYRYDASNRVVEVILPNGRLTYRYDLAGRRTRLTQPGLVTETTYDALGRVESVRRGTTAPAAELVARYAYDTAGRLKSTAAGNGVVTAHTSDSAGRVKTITVKNGTTTLFRAAYEYDARGQRTSETSSGFSARHTYDPLGRLTQSILTVGGSAPTAYRYEYDKVGNRKRSVEGAVTTTYDYDAANRLTRAGTRTVTSDNAGRVLNDGTSAYTWDSTGRLIAVRSGATTARYAYDGDGNRVSETVGTATTRYLIDPIGLSRRVAAIKGSITERYVFGPDLAAVLPASGGPSYQHADALGSVRLGTSQTRAVTDRSNYAPFGARLSGAGVFGFTGEPSSAGGTLHLRAREYDPRTGRFLSQDPAGPDPLRPQTLDRYTYVVNAPVDYTDPTGLCEEGWVLGVRRAFGRDCGPKMNMDCTWSCDSKWYDAYVRAKRAKPAATPKVEPRPLVQTPPPPAVPVPSPAASIVASGAGNAISTDGASLIGQDGAGLIGQDGAGLIGQDGAGIVASGAGNVISTDGASLISQDGAGLTGGGGPRRLMAVAAPPLAEGCNNKQ